MTPLAAARYRFDLLDLTLTFVPFGLLLGTALLVPEMSEDPTMDRTVYSIWVTIALVTPALCAFALPDRSQRQRALWRLFWTFAFIAYLVHALYAYFGVYQGSFSAFLAGQGVFPAIINVVFTLWWALDVWLAWFWSDASQWVRVERVAAHVFIGLTFFASAVVLKHGFVNVLGALMTAATLVCLLIRHDSMTSAAVAQ